MLVYVTRLFLILTFYQAIEGATKKCEDGWFGPWCDLVCNCQTACNPDGTCTNNGKCKDHTFGPGCQYSDTLSFEAYVPIYLKDADPNTCNPDANAVSVAVTFSNPLKFTWLRIIVNNPEKILDFTMSHNGGIVCWNERKYVVNNETVDATCDLTVVMNSVIVIGGIAPAVCNIQVSGGRNVAIRQMTWQSSNFESNIAKCKSQNAVDYKDDNDYKNGFCSQTAVESQGPEWSVTFRYPTRISKLFMISAIGSNMAFSEIYFHDAAGRNLRTITNGVQSNVYVLTVHEHVAVSQVVVKSSIQVPYKERYLSICEFKAFGEPLCPNDTYGLFCEKQCTCNENEICNDATGACAPGCPNGSFGFNCSQSCSKHCVTGFCDVLSGSCQPCEYGYFEHDCQGECQTGTYGLSYPCKNCSLGCRETCNNITGECSCIEMYLGKRCDECMKGTYLSHSLCINCSYGCTDECEPASGKCTCKSNFAPPTCAECLPGRYGTECESECAVGCAFHCKFGGFCTCKANFVGVFCADCSAGMYGPYCNMTCGEGCTETCNGLTGNCVCKRGYQEPLCAECSPGLYGVDCKEHCQKGCSTKCSKLTGLCSCFPNYVGKFCQDCRYGVYGEDCHLNCSLGCADRCNLSNGMCTCKKYFRGDICQECIHPRYGRRCDLHCSTKCFNQTCSRMTGQCSYCIPDHHGDFCELASEMEIGWMTPIPFVLVLIVLIAAIVVYSNSKEEADKHKRKRSSKKKVRGIDEIHSFD